MTTGPSSQPSTGLIRHLDDLLTCSICISTFVDPFVTPCGHSFCYSCINQHLAAGEREAGAGAGRTEAGEAGGGRVDAGNKTQTQCTALCPQCSRPLERHQLNPSFALNGVVKHVSQMRLHASQEQGPYLSLKHLMITNRDYLSSKELEMLSKQVMEYKQEAEQKEKAGTMNLLLHFLHQSKEEKARRLDALQREIECLDADITACSVAGILGDPVGGGPARKEGGEGGEGGEGAGVTVVTAEPAAAAAEHQLEVDSKNRNRGRGRGRAGEAELEDEERERERRAAGKSAGTTPQIQQEQRQEVEHQPQACKSATEEPKPKQQQQTSSTAATADTGNGNTGNSKGSNTQLAADLLCSNKRRRIASQFEDLQSVYLKLRSSSHGEGAGAGAGDPDEDPGGDRLDAGVDGLAELTNPSEGVNASVNPSSGLQKFSKILGTLAHANRLRILAEIPRPPLRNQSSIISSVEYDRNGKLFATAGVSKRISVFDHTNTMANAMQDLPIAHCPIVEMVTRSKLSCISWNKFISSELASSDYEGVLNVWDTSTGNLVHEYEAHSKRIWSVDFCCADPKLLATGSDDSFVKVWSTRSPAAIAQCDVKANVCAVKWHPTQPHTVAIGAADHNVYVYDMRKYDTCLNSFSGHKKAVSYVRWAGNDEIVSASTDSTLRLWHTANAAATTREERIYRGHANERNFVGLAVSNDDFILCGSETHEVYAYYKPLSKPITKIALPVAHAVGGRERERETGRERERPFVSAVSWHPTKKELLSATSQGSVFVLSLEGDLDN